MRRVTPERFESCNPQGTGYYHPLLLVIRGRDTFKHPQPIESNHSALSFVRDHPSYSLVENTRRSSEVVGTAGWVGVHSLSEVRQVFQFVTVE